MISSIIQALFLKIQRSKCVQEKKRQRIYDLLNAETKLKKKKKIRNDWRFFMASIEPRS